jgi:hypothetical protein
MKYVNRAGDTLMQWNAKNGAQGLWLARDRQGRWAGALVAGASVAASSTLGFACCQAAWRMLKPIKQEMRDACAYRSTGAEDEPRYSPSENGR